MTAGWAPEPRVSLDRLRAGSADRERAIDVLKAAFAEGRLDQDEYTERVGQVHAARTYGELAALTCDLPVGPLGSLAPPAVPASLPPAPAPPAAEFGFPPFPETRSFEAQSLDARSREAWAREARALEARGENSVAAAGKGEQGVSNTAIVSLLCGVLAVLISWAFLLAVPALLGGCIVLTSGRRGRWAALAAIALGLVAAGATFTWASRVRHRAVPDRSRRRYRRDDRERD